MRVASPIGDLPFEPRAVKIHKGRLVIEGGLGAWPAAVSMDLRDGLALLKCLPRSIIIFSLAFLVALATWAIAWLR